MAMKATKKDFCVATIASASSHPAQLFRAIWFLNVLPQENQKDKELDISCEAFVHYFAEKILLLCHDLPVTFVAI